MPLSELIRLARGELESDQQKATTCSNDEFASDQTDLVELVWENGQIMMQGQSCRAKKSPTLNHIPSLTPRVRDKFIGNANTSRIGKVGAMESVFNDFPLSVASPEMDLSPDDDMVPWLNYTLDNGLQPAYGSELLPEISGVTATEHAGQSSAVSVEKRGSYNRLVAEPRDVLVQNVATSDQRNESKVSSRFGATCLWSPQQGQGSVPSLGSGVSDIFGNNPSNKRDTPFVDPVLEQDSVGSVFGMKMQKQNMSVPSSGSNLLNFSHFSRPAARLKTFLQNTGGVGTSISSGIERIANIHNECAASRGNAPKAAQVEPCGTLQKDVDRHNKSDLPLVREDVRPLVTKTPECSCPIEQSDNRYQEDPGKNDMSNCQVTGASAIKGIPDGERTVEPVVASSSVCSGSSVERTSNDQTQNFKRKRCDNDESECRSEDVEEESVRVKKSTPARGGSGVKRSRAAEVHNLSERRRRDRINEKMRALQELIPNCNKADKASMLDEAIEYLKTLQLQVQIMSMGAGLCMPPMMFPAGMHPIHAAHMPHFSPMGVGMGMGMGMGFGMSMVDINGGTPGCPMFPVPPIQGAHFSSPPIPGSVSLQGVAGPSLPVFPHPNQGLPLPVPRPPLVPLSGRPPASPARALNSSKDVLHQEILSASPSLNSKEPVQNQISQPMLSTSFSSPILQTSNQLNGRSEGFNQSILVSKGNQDPDVGGNAAVSSTNADDFVPNREAGKDCCFSVKADAVVLQTHGHNWTSDFDELKTDNHVLYAGFN